MRTLKQAKIGETVYDVTNRALMLGNEKGEFMPKNGATRAEAATVFYRFLNGNTEN